MEQGQTYDVVLTPGYISTEYEEIWTIWIDNNNDGYFSSLEKYTSNVGIGTIFTTITIPDDAILGEARMRIQMRYNDPTNLEEGSCLVYMWGETEDYTVIITSDCVNEDEDGYCDENDTCLDFDNALIGTPCDDGNDYTLFDVYQESCECAGTFYCEGELPPKELKRQGALYGVTDFPLDGDETYTWYDETGKQVAYFVGRPYYSPSKLGTYTLIVRDPDYPECQQVIGDRTIESLEGCCELEK